MNVPIINTPAQRFERSGWINTNPLTTSFSSLFCHMRLRTPHVLRHIHPSQRRQHPYQPTHVKQSNSQHANTDRNAFQRRAGAGPARPRSYGACTHTLPFAFPIRNAWDYGERRRLRHHQGTGSGAGDFRMRRCGMSEGGGYFWMGVRCATEVRLVGCGRLKYVLCVVLGMGSGAV